MSKQILKLSAVALLVGLVAVPAEAATASEAKAAGLIKEDCVGHVVALKPEGNAVAAEINAKRDAEYKSIAASKGVPVEQVAATTGAKLCGK
jgi:uncharacterized protein YdbL (DUF1318 family)